MSSSTTFLVQAFILIGLPPGLWNYTGIKRFAPLVVVQIIVGILLGPSVLGHFVPDIYAALFPSDSVAALNALSSFAIVLFALTLGVHFSGATIRGRGRAFTALSVGNVVIPTLIGAAIGWWATSFPGVVGPKSTSVEFSLAIGICLGITALPVLGATLKEMQMLDHRIGHTALGLAVVSDLTLWLLLSALLAHRGINGDHEWALLRLAIGGPIYLLVIWFAVRILSRLAASEYVGARHIVLACCFAFASAAVTDTLGLHSVLGAFIAGAVLPRKWREKIIESLEVVSFTLLLPFFFMSNGLKVLIDFSAAEFNEILIAAILAGIIGKVAGTAIPSRLSGSAWGEALCLGFLMQTKGLMEMIVLMILLENEVITRTAFSALVLAAVATTALSMPFAKFALTRTRQIDFRLSAVAIVPERET